MSFSHPQSKAAVSFLQGGLTIFLACSKQIMDPEIPQALRLQGILIGASDSAAVNLAAGHHTASSSQRWNCIVSQLRVSSSVLSPTQQALK